MRINGQGHDGHAWPGGPFTHADGADSSFIRLDRVYKVHRVGDVGVAALGGVSFDVARGEFAAIVGPSGAGKSTILNLIGGVDTPTAGLVSVGGTDLSQLDTAGLSAYRRWTVGFLWQGTTKNLVPYLTVAQNAELPLLLAGVQSAASRRRRITDLLADEPTAEIDAEGADQVVQALRAACTEFGSTVFMATHDLIAASKTDTTFRLIDGRVRGPAGRASLDASGRITLPLAAASLLGSAASEVEVELEGHEVRIRRSQEPVAYQPARSGGRAARAVRSRAPSAMTSDDTMAAAAASVTGSASVTSSPGGRAEAPLLSATQIHRRYGRSEEHTSELQSRSDLV